MDDFLKYIQDKFKKDTVLVIALVIVLNSLFYKFHNEIEFNNIGVRVYTHISLTIIVIMFEFIRRWYKTKPFLKGYGGFLWNSINDEDNSPYCTRCKICMTYCQGGVDFMQCPECKNIAYIRDENGISTNLSVVYPKAREVMKKIRRFS